MSIALKKIGISVWLSALLASVSFAAETRPNIIWIEADDLMPRFMNKLGGGFGHTPNLDRLATDGIYFPNAVCQAPMCGPVSYTHLTLPTKRIV